MMLDRSVFALISSYVVFTAAVIVAVSGLPLDTRMRALILGAGIAQMVLVILRESRDPNLPPWRAIIDRSIVMTLGVFVVFIAFDICVAAAPGINDRLRLGLCGTGFFAALAAVLALNLRPEATIR